MKKMTQKVALKIRETTYRFVDVPRCETCGRRNLYGKSCTLPSGKNRGVVKEIQLSAVCDLWTKREPGIYE